MYLQQKPIIFHYRKWLHIKKSLDLSWDTSCLYNRCIISKCLEIDLIPFFSSRTTTSLCLWAVQQVVCQIFASHTAWNKRMYEEEWNEMKNSYQHDLEFIFYFHLSCCCHIFTLSCSKHFSFIFGRCQWIFSAEEVSFDQQSCILHAKLLRIFCNFPIETSHLMLIFTLTSPC